MNTEEKYYVYVWYIVNPFEVFYVGKGSGKRVTDVRSRNKFFKSMYETHECAYRIVVDHLTEAMAFEIEKIMIAYIREKYPKYRLTNICDGGEGVSGWIADEVYRENMRIRNLGVGNPNYHNWWSEERKQALPKKIKESGSRKRELNAHAKPVMCVETGKVYQCIADAMDEYGINTHGSITVALKNPTRTAGGCHWVTGDMIVKLSEAAARTAYLQQYQKIPHNATRIQCIESNELIYGFKTLADKLGISKYTVTQALRNTGKFVHSDRTYILL